MPQLLLLLLLYIPLFNCAACQELEDGASTSAGSLGRRTCDGIGGGCRILSAADFIAHLAVWYRVCVIVIGAVVVVFDVSGR
ncbi:hypothetical protein M758_1G044300 [Ceratodon purpureus]|uniref:Secreted protein n=1 Tax=Ceratodon purpureus TaxID=3225 RepID=A0A8T0J4L5_CERPU|nr:hypothetical protein KC19_1G047000 [Ceratodon purpureus]KAG0628667.1 hypothetical protein M758_1G044300 [Ceratodon purpureus]